MIKFYVHDLTKGFGPCQFHLSSVYPVDTVVYIYYPHIDPVLHILFFFIILRSFWNLKSPKLVTSVPLWAEKHISSLAHQFRSMAGKWIAGAWQWLRFRSRPRSSSQFASAPALWIEFSRYHCHLPLLDLQSRQDQYSFPTQGCLEHTAFYLCRPYSCLQWEVFHVAYPLSIQSLDATLTVGNACEFPTSSNIILKTRVSASSAVWIWNFRCLCFNSVANSWIAEDSFTFPLYIQEYGEPDKHPSTCPRLPPLQAISTFFWTQAPFGLGLPWLLEQFNHKLEYCTVGSLRLRLWRRLFTGGTPPNREASGLVRKGVGQWIIFRAVATPVPAVYPIPSP